MTRTIRAGRASSRSVSVCGDAASDPALGPVLLDAGRVRSVAPAMLDEIRTAVRAHGAGPSGSRARLRR